MMTSILKQKAVLAAITILLACVLGQANAQDASKPTDEELLKELIPEFDAPPINQNSATTMSCLVATPSFDYWGSPDCMGLGTAFTTTANFRIENAPSNFTVLWSDSSCSSTRTFCSVPIRQYSPVTMDATVLDNSNNTFTNVSATAYYEGYQ